MKKEILRVNTTLNSKLLQRVDQFAEENLEDRSTAVRQLISKGLLALQEEKILKLFQEARVTVREAAKELGITYWEMNDLLEKRNIPLTNISEAEVKERRLALLPIKKQKSKVLA